MLHQSACECGNHDCPMDGGYFYTSIRRDDGNHRLMLGPFPTHSDALAAVRLTEHLADRTDPRAHWYAYGTCRMEVARRTMFIPCLNCGEIHYYMLKCKCSTLYAAMADRDNWSD